MSSEKEHLDRIASHPLYAAGPSAAMVAYTFEVFARHYRSGPILEVGPAEGVMTELLAQVQPELSIVEGSEIFCADLRRRFPQAAVHCSLVEDFTTERRFQAIVLSHVLEHVLEPVPVLRSLGSLLAPGGFIFLAVPNSRSIHRQAGVLLGQLEFEESMSPLDHAHGHRRVYNPETLRHDIRRAGLQLGHFGGFWLKAYANAQIQTLTRAEDLRAYFRLGERYPDIAAELYAIVQQP